MLLLTNNLLGNEFDVLKTSEYEIESQLVDIGRFCCNYDGDRIDLQNTTYQHLINDWGIAQHVTLDQRLADMLRDILAPYAMKVHGKKDPYVAEMAKNMHIRSSNSFPNSWTS